MILTFGQRHYMQLKYKDIPKDVTKGLRKQAVKQNRRIRICNSVCIGLSICIASISGKAIFPQREDRTEALLVGMLIVTALTATLWRAIVEPQIRREVETMASNQDDKE